MLVTCIASSRRCSKKLLNWEKLSERLHLLYHEIKTFRLLRPKGSLKSLKLKEKALSRINDMLAEAKGDANDGICKKLMKFMVTLENAKNDLLTAIEHPYLWLTNNTSERNLRKFVIHRKIRGFVASEKSKKALSNFATVFESQRQQGKLPYQSLKEILTAGG